MTRLNVRVVVPLVTSLFLFLGACNETGQKDRAGLSTDEDEPCTVSIERLSAAAMCISETEGTLTFGYVVTSTFGTKPADVSAIVDGVERVIGRIDSDEWTVFGGTSQAGDEAVLFLSNGSHVIELCVEIDGHRDCATPFGVSFECQNQPCQTRP